MKINEIVRGDKQQTIRACPAMQDWMNMGYLIRNRHTVLVVLSKNPHSETLSIIFPIL